MELTFDEIKIGQTAQYERIITADDIHKFAEVSGDHNPLHLDEEYAKSTIFKGRIAHGLLSASFISTVLANQLPGPGTVYLHQDLDFLKPVRIGDRITTIVKVLEKNAEKKRITLQTQCINQNNKIVVEGKAIVMKN